MAKLIRWFEIPVKDFKRAVKFYSKVLRVDFIFEEFRGIPHAIFKNISDNPFEITGALVEVKDFPENTLGGILFFNADSGMNDILERVEQYGGKVLLKKTLIKNSTEDGRIYIAKTLIDNNTGYFAYFLDSEGNKMGLYSNS
jgi:predicted enzyme related to lactoylglutathione lyase